MRLFASKCLAVLIFFSLIYTAAKAQSNIEICSLGTNGKFSWAVDINENLWLWGDGGKALNLQCEAPEKIMNGIKAAAAGKNHIAVLTSSGSVLTAGNNEYGQLCDGSYTDRTEFVKVFDNARKVVCGDNFTAILAKNGELYACGHHNGAYNIGPGEIVLSTPVKICDEVKDVYAAPYSVFILKNDGTLYAAGDNGYGQLGCGGFLPVYELTEIMSDVKTVSAAREYTLILKNNGILYGCGWNLYGQLGEQFTDTDKPVEIMDCVQNIAATKYATLVFKTDGSLSSVGGESFGFANGVTSGIDVLSNEVCGVFSGGMVLGTDGSVYFYDDGLSEMKILDTYVSYFSYVNGEVSAKICIGVPKAKIITAFYSDGVFRHTSIASYQYSEDTNGTVMLEGLTFPDGCDTVKLLVWDGTDTIKPIAESNCLYAGQNVELYVNEKENVITVSGHAGSFETNMASAALRMPHVYSLHGMKALTQCEINRDGSFTLELPIKEKNKGELKLKINVGGMYAEYIIN